MISVSGSAKKTRVLFSTAYSQAAMDEQESQRMKLTSKIHDEYDQVRTLPEGLVKQQKEAAARAKQQKAGGKKTTTTIEEQPTDDVDMTPVQQLIDTLPQKLTLDVNQGVVALRTKDHISDIFGDGMDGSSGGGGSLVRRARAKTIRPVWHAPWKLMRVISGHLGWVRAVAVEPGNKWFATGAGD
ncbi:unnamed protein product [Absidia cylindrospora]